MKLACTECSLVIDTNDLCQHRSPVCWACCPDMHPFRFPDDEDNAA